MGILSWFKGLSKNKQVTAYKEIGNYRAIFYGFGGDIWQTAVVRSCIRPIADHTSKAHAVCSDKRLERILNLKPNEYMTGTMMLAKTRTLLEVNNTAFIFIARDDTGKITGFYPVPYQSFEAVEYNGRLYIQFKFAGDAVKETTFAWEDLIPLRKDYKSSDIAGDDNCALIRTLELIQTTNDGIANAVVATANLRGIIRSKIGMLSDEDRKKQRDQFVRDYMNIGNEGGVASLDSSQEFIPVNMNPTVTSWATQKEFREDVYRYYGISDSIIMSDYTEEQMEGFYDARIEPFLVQLSEMMTRRVFTERELGYDNFVVYESNRIQYASTKTKLQMVQLVDRGALTPNEWRGMFNLAPVVGGDKPIRRLDTAEVNESKGEEQDGSEG